MFRPIHTVSLMFLNILLKITPYDHHSHKKKFFMTLATYSKYTISRNLLFTPVLFIVDEYHKFLGDFVFRIIKRNASINITSYIMLYIIHYTYVMYHHLNSRHFGMFSSYSLTLVCCFLKVIPHRHTTRTHEKRFS